MTAADRMNVRGMSLSDPGFIPWPVLPPSPRPSNREGGSAMSTAENIRGYEYSTYVPYGTMCVKCGTPIDRLERARRVALAQLPGSLPEFTYQHADDCTGRG